VLFALVSVARKLDVDPEAALRGTLERFGQRVRWVETRAKEQGHDLSALDEAALDLLWQQAKSST
jgi:ATP diphosphatase